MGNLNLCTGELNLATGQWKQPTHNSGGEKGWKKEEMYVDSGATDTVCPKEFSPTHETKETKESKSGKFYKAANDSKIGVYGRKTIEGMTDDWSPVVVKAEVADVRRCLGSVIRMCEAGNVVHFESGNNYIQNVKSGKRTYMRNNGKGYVVDMWVPVGSKREEGGSPSFIGQGKP